MKRGLSAFSSMPGSFGSKPGKVSGATEQQATTPALPWEVPSPGSKRSIRRTSRPARCSHNCRGDTDDAGADHHEGKPAARGHSRHSKLCLARRSGSTSIPRPGAAGTSKLAAFDGDGLGEDVRGQIVLGGVVLAAVAGFRQHRHQVGAGQIGNSRFEHAAAIKTDAGGAGDGGDLQCPAEAPGLLEFDAEEIRDSALLPPATRPPA